MTAERKYTKEIRSLFFITISVFISFSLSYKLSSLTKEGLILCFNSVVGSVFPFMILSDILSSRVELNGSMTISRIFKKLFKIGENALPAFILGQICGFPIGAKLARDQYKCGRISKEEFERLIGFSSNASPAFVIAGIGAAMRGCERDGIVLYIIMVISSIIAGILFGIGKSPSASDNRASKYRFSLTASVRDASTNTLTVCGFITLFSVISGILTEYLNLPFAVIFIEITGAAKLLSGYMTTQPILSFILTAFAISFSGLCVHLQMRCFVEDISLKPYYMTKITSGIISILLSLIYIGIK